MSRIKATADGRNILHESATPDFGAGGVCFLRRSAWCVQGTFDREGRIEAAYHQQLLYDGALRFRIHFDTAAASYEIIRHNLEERWRTLIANLHCCRSRTDAYGVIYCIPSCGTAIIPVSRYAKEKSTVAEPDFDVFLNRNPWLSVLAAQMDMGRSLLSGVAGFLQETSRASEAGPPIAEFWSSPNSIFRELTTMRVREFAGPTQIAEGKGARALIVAPFALHTASIADFAPGHSLVSTLANRLKIFVTDWRSATCERRFDTIDSLLGDLNVAVDDICAGRPLALIGLCQGGWLAAMYGSRFPEKVSCVTLAGAPIDIAAERSAISDLCAATPLAYVDELIRLGGGLVKGDHVKAIWPFSEPTPAVIDSVLQNTSKAPSERDELRQRFLAWYRSHVDLPGAYYRQTYQWIFRENRLANGQYQAMGVTVDLKSLACPLFLLGSRDDEIVGLDQLMATQALVSAAPADIEKRQVMGPHLSLFMGQSTLAQTWPLVGEFIVRAEAARSRRRARS